MWKPTKAGVYTMDGAVVIVHDNYVLPLNGQMTDLCDGMKWVKESTGIWAMLSPDWQDGAPSAAQLDKWKWWAVEHDGRFIYCGEVRHCKGLQSVGAGLLNPEFITRSAPIQPNGACLWVPLEVVNG